MEELIRKALEKYFSDFKEYHLIILIAFTIVIAIIQVLQTLYVNKRLEHFKNDLKKAEIKFSRYNELQIIALRKIYHLLAEFQLSNNLLFKKSSGAIGHDNFKNRINGWIKSYIEIANEFSKEKILLNQELKDLYSRTLTDFEEVKKKLIDQRENLEYWEMYYGGDWKEMYEYEEKEVDEISQKLDKLKELESLKNSEKHIIELRAKIEEVFSKME